MGLIERAAMTYIHIHVYNRQLVGSRCINTGSSAQRSVTRGLRYGWVGGRHKMEGIYVYLELIHVVGQQKLTLHCKAIILQLKINFKNLLKEILTKLSLES